MKTGRCTFGVGKVSAQPRKPQALPLRQSSGGARRLPPVAASNGFRGRDFDHRMDWDASRDWEAHRLSAHFDSAEASTSGRTEGYYPYSGEDDYADDYLMPFPFTGANDRFMSGIPVSNLMRPGEFKPYMNPHYFPEDSLPYRLEDLKEVFVILFGVGMETEGIYSLRAISREDNLPQDTIIAFVDSVDAERYTGLLEATMQHKPHVIPIETPELMAFCQDSGYICRVEPRGSLLIPPDYNVGMTDWERCVELKKGNYSVLDSDPVPVPDNLSWVYPEFRLPGALPTLENNAGPYDIPFPREESIEAIRRRLDRQWE